MKALIPFWEILKIVQETFTNFQFIWVRGEWDRKVSALPGHLSSHGGKSALPQSDTKNIPFFPLGSAFALAALFLCRGEAGRYEFSG